MAKTAAKRPRSAPGELLMNPSRPLTRDELVRLRRDIHRHPETAFQEHRTSALVRRHLDALGLKSRVLAGTGVASLIEGSAPGRTLMMRCDMDALPMTEHTGYAFASADPGAMHACGHDLHTAILLGTAKELTRERPARGRVKLNFQPAEEGLNGAGAMIKDGIMDNPKVDAVLGYHVWQNLPLGKVGVLTGPCMAAVGRFRITVRGRGGHAAYPHETVDPIVVAAHIVTALQTVVSRNLNPVDTGVVTVGKLQAGSAFNIVPPEAHMEGTIRSFSKPAAKLLPRRVKQIAENTARALGARADVEYVHEHNAVVNDPAMADFMREVVRDVLGKRALVDAEPSMGGEDHSAYQEIAPGCYTFIGSAPRKGEWFPHHHPRFNPDEDVLEIGARLMTEAARRWLARA